MKRVLRFLGLAALCSVGLSALAADVQGLPEGATLVSDGFYQSGATYEASSDFYITSKAGLRHFADIVNTIQRDEGTVAYNYKVNFAGPDNTSNPFSGKTVHLLADVDLGNELWEPIGWDGQDYRGFSSKGVLFHGKFDGGNHTISNIKVVNDAISTSKGKSFGAGLFGKMTAAIEIRNLTIRNVDISNREFYSGPLAGYTQAGVVSNVHVCGSISINGASFVGGLIGYNTSKVDDCSVEMTEGAGLTASGHVGGLVAFAASGVAISGCTVSGVKAESTYAGVWYAIGGLVGYYADALSISSCSVKNVAVVTGDETLQNAGTVIGGNNGTNAKRDVIADVIVEGSTVNGEVAAKMGSSNAEGPVLIGTDMAFDENGLAVNGIYDNIPESFVSPKYMKNPLGTTPETWELIERPVASIGSQTYGSCAQALAAVKDGETITLLVNDSSSITVSNGKKFDLDLNGLTFDGSIKVVHGDVTVRNGTLVNGQPVNLTGIENEANYAVFTLAADASIVNPQGYGIIMWNKGYAYNAFACAGQVANVYGTIKTASGFFAQGNMGRSGDGNDPVQMAEYLAGLEAAGTLPTLNVYEGALISTRESHDDQGVSMNGICVVNVYGGTIEGREAVGVKRGKLNVYGGRLIGWGAKIDPATGVVSATDPTGSAIGITSTYSTSPGAFEVNVSGGEIISEQGYALFLAHASAQAYGVEVKLAISGGSFVGADGVPALKIESTVGSESITTEKFATGGAFSTNPGAAVADGYVARLRDDEMWEIVRPEVQPTDDKPEIEGKVVDENGKELTEDDLEDKQKEAVVVAVAKTTQKVKDSLVSDPVVAGADTKMEKTIAENKDAVVEALTLKAQDKGIPAEQVKDQIKAKIDSMVAGEPVEDTSKYLSIQIGTLNTKVVVQGNDADATPEKLVYEVKPIVKTVVTAVVGGQPVSDEVEAQLPNEAVRQNPITFNLEVFDPKATRAMVKHTSDDPAFGVEVFDCPIWTDLATGKRYITITTTHFSEFEITYSSEITVETAETIGILKIEKDGTDVVAAAVPFKADDFDALVTTGAQEGDNVSSESTDLGAPFWYTRAFDNGIPLTFAGLVDAIPATQVTAGTAEEPVTTLLVNPNRTTANLLAELSEGAAPGDEIALAGGDVRYVFDGGNWTLVTKGNSGEDKGVFGNDITNAVTGIKLEGSQAAWYVSKGGSPSVAWADGSVGAEFVNGTDGALTYGAADWTYEMATPFETDAFESSCKYVRFVCNAGGITFDGDTTGNKTTFLGADGFDWASYDPANSEFWVALLNSNKQVIARSQALTFDELKAAKALDLNYAGNVAPLAATAKATFGGFTVPDDGEYDALTNAFDGVAKVSVDRDADDNFVYTVKMTSDVTGPVELADNLGQVVLNLNGHSISGTVATVDADAGNAIVIGGSIAGAAIPTALLVKNASPAPAAIIGGHGMNGIPPKDGAQAIVIDPERGVTVTASNELVSNGVNGETETAWAWCLCDTAPADPVDLPYGVSYEESTGKYLFWGHDDDGNAEFDFADIAGWEVADDTIHFVEGEIKVSCLKVSSGAPATLRFVGAVTDVEDKKSFLKSQTDASIFDVTAADGQARSWEDIYFTSSVPKSEEAVGQCGGAICMKGGRMTVVECKFEGCEAYENGGAIAAIGLEADSLVTNSLFASNVSSEGNGHGGAIYATAKADGLKLAVVDTSFVGNEAQNGGAIAVYPINTAEKPIALVIRNGEFEDNVADFVGGAIASYGDVEVEEGTTVFADNSAVSAGGAIGITSLNWAPTTAKVRLGRGVSFTGNSVSDENWGAYGGAVGFLVDGGSFEATGVAFVGNSAKGGPGDDSEYLDGGFGGAVDVSFCKTAVIDTCVFDDNEAQGANGGTFYGAAIAALGDAEYSLAVTNSTFRRSDSEAIYIAATPATIVNCVVVGNGGTDYADIAVENTTLDVSYTAYGALAQTDATVNESNNLADRDENVYAGDTLMLRETGLNLVASLGDPAQAGESDFEGVIYGSKPMGVSMGAYEAAQVPVTVTLNGDKVYDGEANSNGCVWTWSFSTNGVPVDDDYCKPDIPDVTTAFVIDSWAFSAEDVGFYASTNVTAKTVTAELLGCDQFRAALDFVYQGNITPSPAALVIVVDPEDNRWDNGNAVTPGVTVKDPFTDEPLVLGTDYVFHYEDNTDPTAEAKVVVDALGNFAGTSSTNFWITAVDVIATFDGEELPVKPAYYVGATGNEEVVVSDAIVVPGYCFDWQNSVTNGTARRVDAAGGMLVITNLYFTDANGDGVPDKYQKKMAAKVVNGTWDDTDAYDRTVWVTLTNGVGKWSADGRGLAAVPELDDGVPASGYTENGAGWLAFTDGKFKVVDPATLLIGSDTAKFLLYAYLRTTSGGSGKGHAAGGRSSRGETTPVQSYTLEDMYQARLAVASFSVSGNMLTLGTRLTVVDTTANDKKIVDGPLADTTVKIEWSKTPGGETESVIEPTTDGDGNATFAKPDADSAFFKIAE